MRIRGAKIANIGFGDKVTATIGAQDFAIDLHLLKNEVKIRAGLIHINVRAKNVMISVVVLHCINISVILAVVGINGALVIGSVASPVAQKSFFYYAKPIYHSIFFGARQGC